MVRVGSVSDSEDSSSISDDDTTAEFFRDLKGSSKIQLTTKKESVKNEKHTSAVEQKEVLPEDEIKEEQKTPPTNDNRAGKELNLLNEASLSNIELVKVDGPISIHYHSIFDNLPDEILLKIFKFVDIPGVGRMAQVCKRFHSLSNDLPTWRAILYEKTKVSEHDSDVNRSYYIRKFKQYKEKQRRLDEEQRRERENQQLRERANGCASIMTCVAFNRVYEWLVTFGLIFITIASVLKLDGIIDWNWALIFVPFYFIIFQSLYAPILFDTSSVYFQNSFEEEISDNHRYCGPIFYLLLYIIPLGYRADFKRRFVVYFNIAMTATFLILFCIKIISEGAVGWWAVFLPLLLQCIGVILALTIGHYDKIWEDDQWLDRGISITLCVVLMLSFIFFFLKLDDLVDWSWYIALIPLFILESAIVLVPCALTGVGIFGGYSARYRTRWSDDTSAFCIVAVMVSVLLIAPLLTLEVLLAQKAEGDNDISYVMIFIPLFIIEGCACVGCVIVNFVASFD